MPPGSARSPLSFGSGALGTGGCAAIPTSGGPSAAGEAPPPSLEKLGSWCANGELGRGGVADVGCAGCRISVTGALTTVSDAFPENHSFASRSSSEAKDSEPVTAAGCDAPSLVLMVTAHFDVVEEAEGVVREHGRRAVE